MELTYKLEASSLTARRPSLYLVSIGGSRDGVLSFKLPPFDGAKLEIAGRRYRLVAGSSSFLLASCYKNFGIILGICNNSLVLLKNLICI